MIVATIAISAWGFDRPIDHDEHQFVASGVLLARDGMLPYRDFPYFHLPYLSVLHAMLFLVTDHLLLSARGLATAFAVSSLVVVFFAARTVFDGVDRRLRFVLALSFAIALAVNPLFMYATGRAWNHHHAVFFALVAFLLECKAVRSERPAPLLVYAGAALGLAVGIRSSFAILLPGYVLGLLPGFGRNAVRPFVAHALFFGLGCGLALLPLVPFLLASPEGFVYGNLRYNLELNPAYYAGLGHGTAMSLASKVEYLLFEVLELKRVAFLAFSVAVVYVCLVARPARRYAFEMRLVALLLPFLLIASFSATPSWYQYYYAPVPFLILAVAYGLADTRAMRFRTLGVACCAVFLLGSVLAARHYTDAFRRPPSQWTAVCVHGLGERIAEEADSGYVLTLGAIFPLEGGARIFEETVTGVFSWRTAPLVDPAERSRLHVAGPHELEDLFDRGIGAVLTGVEGLPEDAALETGMAELAKKKGLDPIPLDGNLHLWVDDDETGSGPAVGGGCQWRARPSPPIAEPS